MVFAKRRRQYAVIVGRFAAYRVDWLLPAPQKSVPLTSSPGARATLDPTDTLGTPHCLGRVKDVALPVECTIRNLRGQFHASDLLTLEK